MSPVMTSIVGDNSDLFPSILSIYAPLGSVVADVTYGTGAFWRSVDTSQYRLYATDIEQGIDARHLPYPDESIDVVVLDPPYIYSPKGTIKKSISVGYALNAEKGGQLLKTQGDVLALYLDCLEEANRVLRRGGRVIVKTKDTIQSGKQFWMHVFLMNVENFVCEDLFVLTQKVTPAMDPKWGDQKHARKNHSFFIILVKS